MRISEEQKQMQENFHLFFANFCTAANCCAAQRKNFILKTQCFALILQKY
jgi:hypothetical protein